MSLKKNILVIDDSPEMLILDRIVLESAGHQVHTSSCGHDALQMISTIDCLDLILLDFYLPDMNGNDFIDILEDTKPSVYQKVPIVYHSALDSINKGKASGIIPKVTDMKTFLEEINRYLQKTA